MNKYIRQIIEELRRGNIVNEDTFSHLVVEEIIDDRDSPAFESPWMSAFSKMKDREHVVLNGDRSQIDELRKLAYLITYDLTKNPDLAAFVSDDFEVIAIAIALDAEDPWIGGLLKSYRDGKFPHRVGIEFSGPLRSIIG